MEFEKPKVLESEVALTCPVPLPPSEDTSDERRIWIGNIDEKTSEFTLLKLLQQCGNLEKLDFLYHKTGPEKGKPRGFCFATFEELADVGKAIKALDGVRVLNRRLVVRRSHPEAGGKLPKTVKKDKAVPTKPVDKQKAIKAIEAKLKRMESEKSEVTLKRTKPYDRTLDKCS